MGVNLKMRIVITGFEQKERKLIKNFLEKQINYFEEFLKKTLKIKNQKENDFLKKQIQLSFDIKKETHHHQKGPYFYAEGQIKIGKELLRVEVLKENLNSPIIELKEKLIERINRYKKKIIAKYERGSRKIKRELKISELAKKKKGKRVLNEGL